MSTETTPTTTDPASGGAASSQTRHAEVTLEYRHSHHVPSDVEYPSEEALKNKIEECLVPGLSRIFVYHKQPKEFIVNVISLRGVDTPFDMPAGLDAEDLHRVTLSVCYRYIKEETKSRTNYMVRFVFKTPPGVRAKKRDCSFSLDPLEDDRHDYDRNHESQDSDRRDEEAQRREDRWNEGRWRDESRSSFQEAYSPYSNTSRERRVESWKHHFGLDTSDRSTGRHDERRRDDHRDDDDRRHDEAALATRRAQLFSPDMMFQFNPDRMSPEGQRTYAEATLPYAMLNNSMGMSYQAFGAAFDMVSSAAREQSRMHAMQMQTTIEREKELMKLPLKFLEIEASNKGHQAQILQESQRNYLDALRMRGEMSERELGYERQNLQSQFQVTESQRQLTDQEEKHHREQGDTFRRDLIRGIGPMALQGLGLFLEYFGQQKLGAAAKMSGTMVEGMMQNIERQQAAAQGGAPPSGPQGPQAAQAPGAPGSASPPQATSQATAWSGQPAQPAPRPGVVDVEATVPGQPAPQAPTIPRRSLRLLDVATHEEIQMQPLRSLCRMADNAFSAADRQRVQQVISPQEWAQLEQALRAASDQECIQGLGMAMFTIGQDPARYERMMEAFAPGQRELLNMIGDVMQGKVPQLDPNYEVRVRPPLSRMRTVLQQDGAGGDAAGGGAPAPTPPPQPSGDAAPVPPSNLDAAPGAPPPDAAPVPPAPGAPAVSPTLGAAPVPPSPGAAPVPPSDLDVMPVPEDVPRPSAPTPGSGATGSVSPPSVPDGGDEGVSSFQEQVLDQMREMQTEVSQMRQEGAARDSEIRRELDKVRAETKVRRPTKKRASRARSSKKKPSASRAQAPKKRTDDK